MTSRPRTIPQPVNPEPARHQSTVPRLAICCITFNHARFITRALDSFLAQKTQFPVEIIIHDDCSTDGTADIIRRYQAHYPGRIRAVLRTENQYALGRKIMPMFVDWVDSEFLAICEGDDYWTDPEKLQIQVDYLKANPECAGCFHDSQLVDVDGNVLQTSYFQSEQQKFSQRDVLNELHSRQPTCSMVFRKAAFAEPLPDWYLRRPSDLYLDILLTNHGTLGFIRRNMAAYRKHSGGTWSGQRESNQVIELIVRFKLLLADPLFFGKHRELILRKIDEFQAMLFTRSDTAAEIDRLDKVVAEQAAYIKSLETERNSLRDNHAHALAESERHLGSLSEQDRFITQLKQQHTDLEAFVTSLRTQLDALGRTAVDQAAYIDALKTEQVSTRSLLAAEQQAFALARNELVQAGAQVHQLQALLGKASTLVAAQEKRIAHLVDQLLAQEQTEKRLRLLAQSRLTLLKKAHVRQASHTQHLIDTLSTRHPSSSLTLPDAS